MVLGLDVSSHQGNVDWNGAWAVGARFAYVKATEADWYRNPYFAQQYNGSYQVGMIRGAYHFALPNVSSGRAQADYFVANGGGWSADGRTLPPALDIEANPYQGDVCYGRSQADLTSWIHSFTDEVHLRTGRWPTIYTGAWFWSHCVGSADFGADPLWLPRYGSEPGSPPCGWSKLSFWQFADRGRLPGDQDWFLGGQEQLRALAMSG
jgi:GH25 family lysozyme M1 (1,4-beta-N-acetylmuramidase)